MSYLGVYKVLFSYAATTPEELSVEENDLLYILEKSTTDEWWKVKKRTVGSDVDEPEGLVPMTYIEPAPVISSATALYDYTKHTDEELSFAEGEQFDVFDTSDSDWTLVGNKSGTSFGFVPANYVEIGAANKSTPAAPVVTPVQAAPDPSSFAPPPQRYDRQAVSSQGSKHKDLPVAPSDDEIPPEKPRRPRSGTVGSAHDSSNHRSSTHDSSGERRRITNDSVPRIDDDFDASRDRTRFDNLGISSWQVAEIEGKKKKRLTLGIGNGKIYLSDPDSDNEPRKWTASKLVSFSAEKKHVFLDFRSPSASIELHAGSKDNAREILSLLGEVSGAVSTKALEEVKAASKPQANGYKTGIILYNFKAQNKDELNAQEDDLVYIVNDKKSPDWWLVENIDTGKRGVVPSTYVSVGGERKSLPLADAVKSTKRHDRKEDRRSDHKDREQREREKERERRKRDSKSGKSKSKPNVNKLRTWVDKSGSFKVEAEFLGCVEGKIHLHKANGVKIAVAAEKLSLTDIEYVEKVTGFSLEKYKSKHREKERSSRSKRASNTNSGSSYDWFDFFLNCGVDLNQCQRYSINFDKEQLDESSQEDIRPPLLRNLGVREGDIIRIMRFLDKKFGRVSDEVSSPPPTKQESRKQTPTIDSKNLNGNNNDDDAWTIKPSATQTASNTASAKPQVTSSLQDLVDLKPLDTNYISSTSTNGLSKTAVPAITPTKTGSSIQLGMQKTGNSILNSLLSQKTGSSIKSQKTGSSMAPLDPFKTGGHNILPVTTGAPMIMPYATGGAKVIVPVQTMQPVLIGQPTTTFNSTTGASIMPLQPVKTNNQIVSVTTGGAMPATSFGGTTVTSVTTGGGMISVTTGGGMPATSFGNSVQVMTTGGMPQMPTGGTMPINMGMNNGMNTGMNTGFNTGMNTGMNTGFNTGMNTGMNTGFNTGMNTGMPVNSFNQMPMNTTGGASFPNTSFGNVPMTQNTNFGQNTGFVPTAENPFPPAGSMANSMTGANSFNNNMNTMTNMFQNTSISPPQQTGIQQGMNSLQMMHTMHQQQQQPQQPQPQPQQITGMFQPQSQPQPQMTGMFQQQPQQQLTSFGQTSFGAPSTSFGMPQTSFGSPQPATSFGASPNMFQQNPQQPFQNNVFGANNVTSPTGGFTANNIFNQPLTSQPTGFGFGNGPN